MDQIDQIQAAVRQAHGDGSSDFDLNPDMRPKTRELRPASVLIALVERPRGLNVLLTRRAPGMRHHPGQVAFPGGKVDAVDAGPADAALREAEEEIGLPRETVQMFGAIDRHETITGFRVTPFVGLIQPDFQPVPETGEVDEVFEVPLAFLMDRNNIQIHRRIWMGKPRAYLAVPYGPHYIWGATARMIKGLADRMGEI